MEAYGALASAAVANPFTRAPIAAAVFVDTARKLFAGVVDKHGSTVAAGSLLQIPGTAVAAPPRAPVPAHLATFVKSSVFDRVIFPSQMLFGASSYDPELCQLYAASRAAAGLPPPTEFLDDYRTFRFWQLAAPVGGRLHHLEPGGARMRRLQVLGSGGVKSGLPAIRKRLNLTSVRQNQRRNTSVRQNQRRNNKLIPRPSSPLKTPTVNLGHL